MKKRISLFLLCVFLIFLSVSCSAKKKSDYTIPPKMFPPCSFTTFDASKFEVDYEALKKELNKIYNDFNNTEKEPKFVVTYSARLSYNNHVGDSWSYGLSCNGEHIKSGAAVKSTTKSSLSVTAFAREQDTYSDYGSTTITFKSLDVGEKQSKEICVTVRENRGRYSGNTAKWKFTIIVERIS